MRRPLPPNPPWSPRHRPSTRPNENGSRIEEKGEAMKRGTPKSIVAILGMFSGGKATVSGIVPGTTVWVRVRTARSQRRNGRVERPRQSRVRRGAAVVSILSFRCASGFMTNALSRGMKTDGDRIVLSHAICQCKQ
jgi:hypothetical protein